jgi:hypothetical protein
MGILDRLRGRNSAARPAASVACPHCDHVFAPPPAGRRKCPQCRNPVVPRKAIGGQPVLLRESDIAAFDAAKKKTFDARRFHRRATSMGASDADWAKAQAELDAKWGRAAAAEEVFWALTNRLVREAVREGSWTAASGVYWQQALMLSEEGQPWRKVREQAELATIRGYAAGGFVTELNVITKGCCRACDKLAGRRFRIEDELRGPSLPPADCDRSWCPCGYTPAARRGMS